MIRKITFLTFFFLICTNSFFGQQKQGVKLEGGLGIPVGDLSGDLVFGLGADLSYLFDVREKFQSGISLGYHNFFANSDGSLPPTLSGKKQDFQFVPLAITSRYYLFEDIFVGTDLGYSFILIDGVDGGFHYKPKIGFSFGLITTMLSYSGIVLDQENFNSINLGFEVAF